MSCCIAATTSIQTTPIQPQPPALVGGGDVPIAASPALAEAITQLGVAVEQLQAVVNAMQGAGSITGGGEAPPATVQGTSLPKGPISLPDPSPDPSPPPAPESKPEPAPAPPPPPPPPTNGNPGKQKLISPVDGAKITSKWGDVAAIRNSIPHTGQDFAVPAGTPIKAAAGGKVVESAFHEINGHYVIVDHGDGLSTFYGHQSERIAKVGDEVKQGDVIGKVGSTGLSTGPHLHFGVLEGDPANRKDIDPVPFLNGSREV
ncbi:MAG: family metallopeptidase [Thermoleophilia bacterium]|nr:family metallopeptidase [Thermoleophilia bacterium]